jgi:hypothetical protein
VQIRPKLEKAWAVFHFRWVKCQTLGIEKIRNRNLSESRLQNIRLTGLEGLRERF